MKEFFREHSYSVVKMFLYQFAISIFGTTLAFASSGANNQTLLIISSIFSIIFYLFLLYTMTWDIGAKEKIRVEAGRGNNDPLVGLYMSVAANVPNIVIAVLMTVGYIFGNENGAFAYEWAGGLCGVCRAISLFLQGMYVGVLNVIGFNPVWFFVIIIPAIATVSLSYYFALKYSVTVNKKKQL